MEGGLSGKKVTRHCGTAACPVRGVEGLVMSLAGDGSPWVEFISHSCGHFALPCESGVGAVVCIIELS